MDESRITELIDALPEELKESERTSTNAYLQELLGKLEQRPIPVGRVSRAWALGTLQAKIAAAYMANWLRRGYASSEEKQRNLNETHLKAALQVLGGMSYLRGAIMKVGQLIANYPNVAPDQFAQVIGNLYFEAPPMHFSLLREFVRNEWGADPEDLFDDFETKAFAAASLGQVHRARLKGSQQRVAIKIQYPGIGRTIRSDFRNLKAVLFPMRLSEDWDNFKAQFEDVRRMLDLETDYEQEAENLRIARSAFRKEEGILVPKVFPKFSTKRVLTMEYVDGVHLDEFMKSNPSQEVRDRFGQKIALATLRLSYGKHLLYADPQPGNYFFMPDGRLGLIDFGCCHHYSETDVDYLTEVEKAVHSSREAVRHAIIRAAEMTPKQQDEPERMHLLEQFCDWVWEPLLHEGPFDFGNPDYFQRGVEIFGEVLQRRYVRSHPINIWLDKNFFGIRAMLAHLKARVDLGAVCRAETTVELSTK